MKKFGISFIIFVPLLWLVSLSSCSKKDFDTDPSLKLTFSADTVIFDTIFTTIGSVTQTLMVYNPNDTRLKISEIRLGAGESSRYKINIDGTPTYLLKDIEIDAGDSLYIFVKVTIDPNNQTSPLIVDDSLMFVTNGNLQKVKLVAWGQDAIYHRPDHFPTDFPAYSIVPCNSIWTAGKPHVIYGWLVVDSACNLQIEAGAMVYFHNNAVLMVYKDGSLQVNGQVDSEVSFRGHRTDPYYKDLPGQWGGILFSQGSRQNVLNHAVILNGTLGVQVDQTEDMSQPQLVINNTRIGNMSLGGLSGNATWIQSENLVIEGCGEYSLSINGGIYQFKHLSAGNYWTASARQNAALVMRNYFIGSDGQPIAVQPTEVFFGNSVIYGNRSDEIGIAPVEGNGTFTWSFDHCLLKTNPVSGYTANYIQCIFDKDPLFTDPAKSKLYPDTLSPLINAGIFMNVNSDILGQIRDDRPDIGAYERIERK
ncbi:MAG: hypothetical protein Q7J34_04505 [Bacteroidales bacterium]|nr:hypothetical protein [Bacteroidales bacterium]